MKLILNEDNDHYFKLGTEYLNENAMRKYVDMYADMGADAISFCIMGQRANYKSAFIDAIWDPLPDGSLSDFCWCVNMKKLHDQGIDPYFIWLDQCRKRNLQAWISFRMNDVHQTHPCLIYRADRNWLTHPEWMRKPDCWPPEPGRDWQYYQDLQEFAAWNYAHPEVRKRMLGLLIEAAERYDAPCYELDFCRDPFMLTYGHDRKEAHFITELIRDFRKALNRMEDERGHKHAIAVRVPYDPEVSADCGFDVRTWCRENLISTLVVSSFWRSFLYNVPLMEWKKIAGPEIPVIPAVDLWICSGPDSPLATTTLPFLAGWCDIMASKGAESVYLFNMPYFNDPAFVGKECAPEFQAWFHEKFSLENMRKKFRRYQVGYPDLATPGKKCTGVLPLVLKPGEYFSYTFPAAEIPESGKVRIVPVFEKETAFTAKLNGADSVNGTFSVKDLSAEGNRVKLTVPAEARLINLYLEIDPMKGAK